MKRKAYLAAIAALSIAAVFGSAYAANHEDNDALAIAGAKIDLGAAVAAAEQHVGGKASRAEYERHNGHWVFDVEVVKGRSVMDVKVDAGNGKVIEARADKADHDDDGDRED
ncbi:MAG: PepSY domain-containing protein [Gallionellaceae bacterium]|nr:PepSY domain-containing protein [Gallionellaceae bacterium]MDD5365551.1 PepSY domain-containing protein [Gallionellaceae bacterium]